MNDDIYDQGEYAVRFDWGPTGATVTVADAVVIVDVFSFSTSVCIACERGMAVYPFRWSDARASRFARQKAAVLAVGRLESGTAGAPSRPSLSPAGLLECDAAPRLVLPRRTDPRLRPPRRGPQSRSRSGASVTHRPPLGGSHPSCTMAAQR